MIIDRLTAIHSLVGGSISGNDTEVHYNDGQTPPTDAAIDAELKRLQAEYEANKYQRDRKQEYPSIEELVVALYDEEDKQAIIERRNAVKAKYPKPE